MALYVTVSLETAEFPDLSADALHRNGKDYYRVTQPVFDWVQNRVRKARQATQNGKMTLASMSIIESRLESFNAICAASAGFHSPRGTSNGDSDESGFPRGELPPPPREYTDTELEALDAYFEDYPTVFEEGAKHEPIVLLVWPDHPDVALAVPKSRSDTIKKR